MKSASELFWAQNSRRLDGLFLVLRSVMPDCPNPIDPRFLDIRITAEMLQTAFKTYSGDNKEILFFAQMKGAFKQTTPKSHRFYKRLQS